MRGDHPLGAVLEGHALRGFEPLARALLSLQFERIVAVEEGAARLTGSLPRLSKRDEAHGSQPHVSRLAIALVAEHPRFRAASGDLEIRAVPDGVSPRLRELRDRDRTELLRFPH